MNVDDREPIVEILAESPGLQLGLQVLVRRGDDPGIHADGLAASDALDLPLLQKPQKLGLQRNTHFRDLVEKQRAAVGELELPLTLDVRARVRAFLVPEQLGLQQRLRDRPAIDRHERSRLSRAVGMNGPGEQLLASASR